MHTTLFQFRHIPAHLCSRQQQLPAKTKAVSSVVAPLVRAPVTLPALSVALVRLAFGAAVSPMAVKLLVAALVLPAASVSLALNW